ncbi:MAG: peptidoglycan-associated lipoprotein Pal [Rubrivivax sp.]|nr:peptidoglycan-associated lipoprotein Pal [Rubrivivax sp.]
MGACSTTPPPAAPAPAAVRAAPPPAPAAAPPAQPPAATRAAPSSGVTSAALPAYLDPKNPIATERSIYFDFDQYTVKPQYTALVERQGKYLAGQPALAIRVEGNCDERGSSAYNLALGQRRADAVVRALKIYGVRDAQMEAISWGKDKPVATGHDEAAWALNRRVDLQYPKQ